MGFMQTRKRPQKDVDRDAVREAVMKSVQIFLDIGFSRPDRIDLRRYWEELGNTAVGEMARYRSIHLPAAQTTEDAADLTCNMP